MRMSSEDRASRALLAQRVRQREFQHQIPKPIYSGCIEKKYLQRAITTRLTHNVIRSHGSITPRLRITRTMAGEADTEDAATVATCVAEWEGELEALRAIFFGEEDALEIVDDEGKEEVKGEQQDVLPRKLRVICEVTLAEGHTLDFTASVGRGQPSALGDSEVQEERSGDVASPEEANRGPTITGIRYLPPVTLQITIPRLYPLEASPELEIACLWLDRPRREKARELMLQMYEETYRGGAGVLYTWVEWCRGGELFSAVGLEKALEVVLEEEEGVQWEARLLALFQHNYAKESEAFQRAMVCCMICMDEKEGRLFTPLHCGHYWCTACLSEMARVHIAEGTVLSLCCPDPQCRGEDAALTPDVVKELVSEDDFARWERLLLQKTLDRMEDLVYCPRCEAPTLEEQGHLGQCVKCMYAFCSLCRDSYHPGLSCMTPEEKLKALEQRVQRQPDHGQAGRDRLLQIRRLAEENMSLQEVKRSAKQCPGCGMAISKTEGCSKMMCTTCGIYFCWLCNKDITIEGYDHFKTGETCQLFEAEEIQRWNHANRNIHMEIGRIVRQQRAEQEVRVVRCGSCNAQNVVLDHNNHIHCWACRQGFCALCRAVVRKHSLHFGGAGKCKQHGR